MSKATQSKGLLAKYNAHYAKYTEFGLIPRQWLGKLGENPKVSKILDIADKYVDTQKNDISQAAKSPKTYRRSLIQGAAGKLGKKITNTDSQLLKYGVSDLDELVQEGNKKLTRGELLAAAKDKLLRRTLDPKEAIEGKLPLADITKNAPPIKQIKDATNTTGTIVDKTRKTKKLKGNKVQGTADRIVENIEGDSVDDILNPESYIEGLIDDGLDSFSKHFNIATFGIGSSVANIAPELIVGGTAGAVQGATYVGSKLALDEELNREQKRNELIANTLAGAASLTGGTLLARAMVNRMMRAGS